MKKTKKVREIVSRPVKPVHKTKEPAVLVIAGGKRLPAFNLEEEAARMAYRYGVIAQDNEPRRVANQVEEETEEGEEEISHRKTEREMVSKEHEYVIEKLQRKIGPSEEKEGWEAFYN